MSSKTKVAPILPEPPAPPKAGERTHKLKLWQIAEIYRYINATAPMIMAQKIVTFRISLNKNKLRPLVEAYDEMRLAADERFIKRDPETKQRIAKKAADGTPSGAGWESDDHDGWDAEYRRIGQIEHDVTFYTFTLDMLGAADVSQGFMDVLVYMIED